MLKPTFNFPSSLGLNCPEFPDSLTFIQFTFLKNISNVLTDGTLMLSKQLSHLSLGQPHRFILQANINFDVSVRISPFIVLFLFFGKFKTVIYSFVNFNFFPSPASTIFRNVDSSRSVFSFSILEM